MEKLYYKDPYLKEAEATVVKKEITDKNVKITLDNPLFYPEGGGQPGDIGYLNDIEVLDTKKGENGESILCLNKEAEDKIKVNDQVKQKLDWNHRYKFMKMHTAQHLLSGLLYTLFNIGTVAVHLGEEYLSIETDRERIDGEVIDKLIFAANKKIWESKKVIYRELSHSEAEKLGLRRSIKVEGDVRIVDIEDTDRIACGGVHVERTSEIGLITAIGHEQIRSHERIFFNCAEKALERAINTEKEDAKLCALLSCKTEETSKLVAQMLSDSTKTKALLASAEIKAAAAEYKEHKKNKSITVIDTKLPTVRFQGLGESEEKIALCAINTDGEKCTWIIILKNTELLDVKDLISKTGARGGGRPPVYQGVIEKDKSDVFFEYIKNKYAEIE